MIGHFNDDVVHLPSGRRGKIVMPANGVLGIGFTAMQVDGGRIQEFPDAELRVEKDGSFVEVKGIRFSNSKPIPWEVHLQFRNNGDGTVTLTGQTPGSPAVTIHNLPLEDGEVVVPEQLFYPVRR